MRAPSLLFVLAIGGLAAACGGKPEPEQPAPEPTPAPAPTAAPAPVDDSAERARLEAEQKARAAAERAAAVKADLAAMINFEYDQATVRSTDQAILDRKAAILGANPNVKVQISGHADERGSDEYNLALGNRRAAAAKRYLENKGIDGSRMEVVSYGEERPLAQGADESSYAQNRRDEFQVTAGGDSLVAPQ
jgi:peptidoglycan-associated lipoprotein